MPSAQRFVWCFVFVLAIIAGERAGRADPLAKPKDAAALEHLSHGNKLYNLRSFEEAAEAYKAGAMIEHLPIFDYNLGQCYRLLGQYKDAIWYYKLFLRTSSNTTREAGAAEKFIEQMEAELNKKAMTEPPIEAAQSTVPSPEHASPQEARQVMPAPTPSIVVTTPAPEPWYSDSVGWALVGTGGVAGGVAIGLLVRASALRGDADRAPSQSEAQMLRDQAGTRTLTGTLVGAGGIALLAGGIIKLAVHPSTPSVDDSRTTWMLGLSPNGIAVAGQF